MGAFALGSGLVVTADGREVIARASDGDLAERWRCEVEAAVVAAAIGDDFVAVLGRDGAVRLLDASTGEAKRTLDVGAGADLLAASDDGVLAAAGPAGVILEAKGELVPMDLRGATALAIHARRLAIGTREGAVRLVDVDAARSLGACRVGGPLRAVAWSPRGLWIAATPHALARVSRDGTEAYQLVDAKELELGPLACDAEGAFVAVRIGARKVALFDLLEGKLRATAAYASEVVGLGFAGERLAIGLAGGDLDVIDLGRGEGLPGKAEQLRMKLEEVLAIRARVEKGEAPSRELMRRPAAAGAPQPTRAAIAAMVGFVVLALVLLYLLRAS